MAPGAADVPTDTAEAPVDTADAPVDTADAPVGAADVQIVGTWRAEIVYDWGDAHSETFKFRRHGHEVLGSASFLGKTRNIREGLIDGNTLTFVTKTKERMGSESRKATHHSSGFVSGDEISFSMLTAGGLSSHVPIEFKARRKGS